MVTAAEGGPAPDGSNSTVIRRVLIVDPDREFCDVLRQDFELRAFRVESALTADEAILRVRAAVPEMVIVDLYLPEGGALKLLRLWKSEAPTVVVNLVSGHASLGVVVDALKEGARRFFTKPVAAAALLEELDERRGAQGQFVTALQGPANHQLGMAALNAEGVDRFFAVSPGLLSVAGFDGYFKALNPAWEKVLGHSVDELCANPYLDLVHPDDREKATDEALEIRGGHTVFRFKNRYRCKDGSYRWLEWSATPSPAHQLIYASARDVTKSVRMEQGLRQSNQHLRAAVASGESLLRQSTAKVDTLAELVRFKDEVAAMIVHDLKTPLSVILSNYEYILDGFEGAPDCLEALQDSHHAGRRMLRLLANLIDVERLEDGTLDVRRSQILLSPLLQPVAEQRRVLARNRGIGLHFASPAEITISVDTDLLIRTVENILDNALRHTPDGGDIEIEIREAGANVEIRIGNSGGAIPPAARGIIFEKYRQGRSDVGRMNLGLGLYFCRLAIEAQGGEIWVEETTQHPAVFGIRLPREATGPRRRPAAQQVSARS